MGLNQVGEKHIQFLCHLWQPGASAVRPQAEMLSSPKVSCEAAKLSSKARLLSQGLQWRVFTICFQCYEFLKAKDVLVQI